MSTVQGGDGQDIHEGEDDGEEGGHLPEHVPVPHWWEQTANGTETTNRLSTVGSEHIFHIAHITLQYVQTVGNTCGETLKETILLGNRLVDAGNGLYKETKFQIRCQGNGQRIFLTHSFFSLSRNHNRGCANLQTVGLGLGIGHHIFEHTEPVGKLIIAIYGFTVDGHNLITLLQTNLSSRRIGHHAVNYGWNQRTYERWFGLEHAQQVDVARQTDAHGLAITDNVGTGGLTQGTVHIGTEILELTVLGTYQNITILKTILLGLGVELHTQGHVLGGDVGVAPVEQNHRVDKEGQQEVDQHTANHHQQALPGRFAAELPRLCGLFHLFGIKTLINHTGNLTVTTQWQPTHTILGGAILGLEFKQTAVPLPDGGVEKEIELLNADAKELGKEEVATLVEQHQQADGQHELQKSN